MSDTISFKPLHSKFVGKAKVPSPYSDDYFIVNLNTHECSCKHGSPTRWNNHRREEVENAYCVHKIKAIADIVKRNNRDPDLVWNYVKALSTRYNRFEVVSAFHKELRLGNERQAWFWGNILIAFRGLRGVFKYLYNIVYEETRDHEFAWWIHGVMHDADQHTILNAYIAIKWFCATPKKWELSHRLSIFTDEMLGYKKLVGEFGKDVAKAGNIISVRNFKNLRGAIMLGAKRGDRALFQYGLKGLQKTRYGTGTPKVQEKNQQSLRMKIYIALKQSAEHSAGCLQNRHYEKLCDYIEARAKKLCIGYHELNALGDVIMGERPSGYSLSKAKRKIILATLEPRQMLLGIVPHIPRYAHDNHTWAGKSAISRFPQELKPGAEQKHIDFRMCGAYMGVGWRYLAYNQFGKCTVKWGRVDWPEDMYKTVSKLFY